MKKIIKIVLIVCICIGAGIGYIFYHFMWDTQSVKKGRTIKIGRVAGGELHSEYISWHWRGYR